MAPHRAKMYVRLFAALSFSVIANLFLFQPQAAVRGVGGTAASGAADVRSALVAAAPTASVRASPQPAGGGVSTAATGSEPRGTRIADIAPKFHAVEETTDLIRSIQRELKEQGHYPGQIDGRPSQLTHAAIFAYQQQHALPLTAEPSEALLKALIMGSGDGTLASADAGAGSGDAAPGVRAGTAAAKLVADVRQILTALGYASGRPDARLSPELIRAIRTYETNNGLLPPTGRITATLVLALQRTAATFRQK